MSSAILQLWEYRETGRTSAASAPAGAETVTPAVMTPPVFPGVSEEQVVVRVHTAVAQARSEAEAAAEQRWANLAEQQEVRRRNQIQVSLDGFERERMRYFREAETEVVHLALAIARKILGREALLDPELLQALVRIALNRMEAGSATRLRVPPSELDAWQSGTHFPGTCTPCELIADPALAPGDCVVETDLGTASFGLETQFKEIEQGMLDLLELRAPFPAARTSEAEVTHVLPSPEGR